MLSGEEKLGELRREIDVIDDQLKELLMRRFDCSSRMAELKAAEERPKIYRPGREASMLRRLLQGVPEGRRKVCVAVFCKILQLSRSCQHRLLSGLRPEEDAEDKAERVREIRFFCDASPGALAAAAGLLAAYGCRLESVCAGERGDSGGSRISLRFCPPEDRALRRSLLRQLREEYEELQLLCE